MGSRAKRHVIAAAGLLPDRDADYGDYLNDSIQAAVSVTEMLGIDGDYVLSTPPLTHCCTLIGFKMARYKAHVRHLRQLSLDWHNADDIDKRSAIGVRMKRVKAGILDTIQDWINYVALFEECRERLEDPPWLQRETDEHYQANNARVLSALAREEATGQANTKVSEVSGPEPERKD
jgi:hypothetical protein